MARRVLVASAVAAAVVVPSAASARPLPPCLSFADARGDSGPGGATALGDATLDVTRVRVSSERGSWVARVTVAGYAERPQLAAGNRYEVLFTLGQDRVRVYWKDSPTRDDEARVYLQQGIYVNDVPRHDQVVGRVDGNVVTIAVTHTMLGSALGYRADGQRATALRVESYGSYVAQKAAWDTAESPGAFVVGQACR